MDAYATSRMSTWLKRKPSSPGNSERSGRTNSLRASASSVPPTPVALVDELAHSATVEEPPLDRAALHDSPLLRLEAVDARREQRLDRGRDGVGVRVVLEVREELFDEERIALGGLDDARAELGPQASGRARCTSSSESPWPSGSRTTSVAPARGAAQEGRTSKRSGRAVQRTRIGASSGEAATYSMRSRSAGSAQWMSSTTSTSVRAAGQRLEEPAKRPGRLVGRAALLDDSRGEVAVADACQHLGRVAGIAHDVGQRQVGGAGAVGRAARDEDPRLVPERVEQLAREPRLADAGRADDGREPGRASGDGGGVRGAEGGQLVPAADERRRDRPRERRHVRPQPDEPVGDERLALALGVDGRRRIGVDEIGARRRRSRRRAGRRRARRPARAGPRR